MTSSRRQAGLLGNQNQSGPKCDKEGTEVSTNRLGKLATIPEISRPAMVLIANTFLYLIKNSFITYSMQELF